MSDINPSKPGSPEGIGAELAAANKAGKNEGSLFKIPEGSKGSGMGAFKKWLGPKQFKQFESMLCQSITNAMKEDKKKADLARRKLKAAEEGKDPDEVTQ